MPGIFPRVWRTRFRTVVCSQGSALSWKVLFGRCVHPSLRAVGSYTLPQGTLELTPRGQLPKMPELLHLGHFARYSTVSLQGPSRTD